MTCNMVNNLDKMRLTMIFSASGQMLTDNEVNNLVYLFLKYGFEIKNPSNEDLFLIVMETAEDRSLDNIIDKTANFVRDRFGKKAARDNARAHLVEYFNRIYKEFMELPIEMRNSLGTDEKAEVYTVKN